MTETGPLQDPSNNIVPPTIGPIWTRTGLALSLTAALIASLAIPATRDSRGDFPIYTLAATRLQAGETFYRTEAGGAFSYPPFMVLPFVPLSWLPDYPASVTYYFLNLLLLGAALTLLARLILTGLAESSVWRQRAASRPIWPVLTAITVLSGRYVISPIENQSNDLPVFLMVMLGITAMTQRRDLRGGLWLGIAVAAKATPLLFLPVWLLQRRWFAAAGMVLSMTAATLAVDVLYPNPTGQLWVAEWHEKFVSKVDVGGPAEAEGAWVSWNHLNQSLSGSLYRLFTPVTTPTEFVWDVSLTELDAAGLKALTIGLQLAVVFLVMAACFRTPAAGEPGTLRLVGQAGSVFCGMLLLSPMSSKQHFCVLVVPVTFAVVSYCYVQRSRMLYVPAALLLALGTFATKDLIGRPLGNELLAYGSLTWCSFAILIAMVGLLWSNTSKAGAQPANSPIPINDLTADPISTTQESRPRSAA